MSKEFQLNIFHISPSSRIRTIHYSRENDYASMRHTYICVCVYVRKYFPFNERRFALKKQYEKKNTSTLTTTATTAWRKRGRKKKDSHRNSDPIECMTKMSTIWMLVLVVSWVPSTWMYGLFLYALHLSLCVVVHTHTRFNLRQKKTNSDAIVFLFH